MRPSKAMKDEPTAPAKYPPRDERGRVVSLAEYIAAALGATAFTFVLLAIVDLLFSGFDFNEFGHISGWISVTLAAFIFIDDFRAWSGTRYRVPVFIAAAILGTVAGLGISMAMPSSWLDLLSGALGAAVSVVVYTILWFTGIRMIGREE